jgi:hypothetical protein
MCEFPYLTNISAATAYYRDSFTFYIYNMVWGFSGPLSKFDLEQEDSERTGKPLRYGVVINY